MKNIDDLNKRLRAFEENCGDDFSLYHGQTGLAIVYFILSAISKNNFFYLRAEALVNNLGGHIANVQKLDFENGLAGIGWGVEWIVQNKYIEANTEEILEDLDDELYKIAVYARLNSLNIENGTLGKAMYFHKRLSAQNPNVNRFRKICNQECLIFLIDDIKDKFLAIEDGLIYKNGMLTVEEYREIAQCLIFLSRVQKLKLNTEITERLIESIADFIQVNKDDNKVLSTTHYPDINAYLIYALYIAGVSTNNGNCQNKALSYYHNNGLAGVDNNNFLLFIDHKLKITGTVDNQKHRAYRNTIFDFLFEIDPEGKFQWQDAFGL
jgi:hypothetical protein